MTILLHELAERLGATVEGDGDVEISGCAPIDTAGPTEITFLANRKYAQFLRSTRAAGVLIDSSTPCPDHVTRLVCDDPYFAFRNALVELCGFRTHPAPIDPDAARIHPAATVADDAVVHPYVVVEEGASVGRRTVLYPGVYIGTGTVVGDDCILYPNVTVYDRCVLGDRVTLHSSTVIGHDGFGYATHGGRHEKIPQTGNVVIEDDVELGAGCAIERAAIEETRIGKGTKFADLISIGHGTRVGDHCLLVSLVGISGSVDVGNYVAIGGQAGVTGHLKIGDGVQVMARAAVARDVEPGRRVGGVPAIDSEDAKRNALAGTDLYGLFKRVRQLEREVRRLREEGDDG
ncbi:MAG: UDP-3-O-(3-hydroxymyristoyl)glucosamine N-acyltransferase [Planctomycetes bacterium]|nr:UDP-3-O-(3-hydroxymyristoyl)glucosamine N-acyltransferase [Planctomycetota bacterium]